MKVLVTGGTGFLGSHLVRMLVKKGYHPFVFKRETSKLHRIEDILEQVNLIEQSQLEGETYDLIYHLATDYGKNKTKDEIFEVNYYWPMGLTNKILEKGLFVNISTSLDPNTNDYAASKKKFASNLLEKKRTYFFVNLEFEHFFGPSDGRFINFLIQSFLDQKESLDLTTGEQVRDFFYYKDAINLFSLILEKFIDNQVTKDLSFSVGFGQGIKVKDLVKKIQRLTKNSKTRLNFNAIKYRDNEPMYTVANIDKVKEFGWHPEYTLDRALKETIDLMSSH